MVLRRGFELQANETVLVVEDVVTTGGSVNEIIQMVRDSGAVLKGVGFIVDRSQGRVNFPADTFSLLKMDVLTYEAQDCPLCQSGIPLVKPGSRNVNQ